VAKLLHDLQGVSINLPVLTLAEALLKRLFRVLS
jgi:hypothetical protein